MKTFLVLLVYTLVICCINCTYSTRYLQSEVAGYIKRFCNLPSESRGRVNFCLLANKELQPALLLYKNCAQQVKYFLTFDELDDYICYRRTEQEYLKFLSCFIPADETLNRGNTKVDLIIKKCLSIEENRGRKKGHQIS